VKEGRRKDQWRRRSDTISNKWRGIIVLLSNSSSDCA